jgi:hypothetical protein
MNQLIAYADQLSDQWIVQASIARNMENQWKLSELSNAKAEQILDDLYRLYECVKSEAPTVADHISKTVARKLNLPIIAQTLFS